MDRRTFVAAGAVAGLVPIPGLTAAEEARLAFPGALGWAARTPGGRSGRVVRVTSLDARGPGSLREALETLGPRTVVFEVGGVIDLGRETLEIVEPFLTIAGQTAPSPGVTLIRGGINIRTHDVVMRHIAIRPGEAGAAKRSGWEIDGVAVIGGRDVIVDHCSCTWATDENLSASGPRFEGATPDDWRGRTSRRITFSNNIVAEGLSNSTHRKGEHSKGSLIHDNAGEVLIVGNLYASNAERNALFKGGARGAFVNNLIYNPGRRATHYNLLAHEWRDQPRQVGRVSQVGNVLRAGPSSPDGLGLFMVGGAGVLELHQSDNLAFDRDGEPLPALVRYGVPSPGHEGEPSDVVVRDVDTPPVWPTGLVATPAGEVEARVLATAGARPWDRDPVDARIVGHVRNRDGRIIDGESEVGGYPAPPSTRRPFDEARWSLSDMTPLS